MSEGLTLNMSGKGVIFLKDFPGQLKIDKLYNISTFAPKYILLAVDHTRTTIVES